MRLWLVLSVLGMSSVYGAFELTWGTPPVHLGLSLPSETMHRDIQVAVDQKGNGIVAWAATEEGGMTERVWAVHYDHASRLWMGAVLLSTDRNASHVSLGMDGEGNGFFAWEEGFPTQIGMRVLRSDGTWDVPVTEKVDPIFPSLREQTSPQICVDEEGNVLALWLEREKGGFLLTSAYREKGGDWRSFPPLSSAGARSFFHGRSALQGNRSGECLAVWEEEKEGVRTLWGARFTRQGFWEAPSQIASQEAGFSFAPAVALDEKGKGMAVWLEKHVVKACRFRKEGFFEETHYTVSHPDLKAEQPAISMDAKGDGLIVYTRSDAGVNSPAEYKFVSASFFSYAGGTPTQPVDVSGPSSATASACHPWVALNGIGDGVVLWKQDDQVLRGAGFSLGSWSLFQPLSHPKSKVTNLAYSDYAAALNPAGQVIAAWSEKGEKETGYQIKASLGVGLASLSPQPPVPNVALRPEVSLSAIGIGSGKQCLCRFPGHGDLYNVLTWTYSGQASSFRIYRGHLGDLAGTTTSPYFEDHQRIPNRQETYLVTAVDADGHESAPLTLVVKPLKLKH